MIATSDAATTALTIRRLGESVIRLADSLARAQSVQHARPAAPSLRQDDTTRKASGPIADPTGDTVADSRRLRLRAAVISGELTAEDIAAKATDAADELAVSLESWAGSRW